MNLKLHKNTALYLLFFEKEIILDDFYYPKIKSFKYMIKITLSQINVPFYISLSKFAKIFI